MITTIKINLAPFPDGARVRGKGSHKGKVGIVIKGSEHFTTVRWDGGKRDSFVNTSRLEAIAS